jgi:hypothetical protein
MERIAEPKRDELLRNSYSPHLTTTTNYTLTYSGQKLNKRENFSFLSASGWKAPATSCSGE